MTKGFQKIQLNKPKTPASSSVVKKHPSVIKKSSPILKFIGIGIIVLLALLVLTGLFVFIQGKDLYAAVQKTSQVAGETYAVAKKQDLEATKIKLAELEQQLKNVDGNLSKIAWLKHLPVLGSYEKDIEHFVKAAQSGVSAGKITVDTLIPYADLLGLKGKSTFVAGSADERLKMAVETLDKVVPNLDKIAEQIAVVDKELEQIDPQRYPEKIGSTTVRSQLQMAKDIFLETASLFVEAQPFLRKLPDILGLKEPKNYLVIFQNDAELRATGGFITGFGIFKIDKGKITVERSDDIYKLDAAKTKKFPAPSPILKYHKNVFNLELRDSNLSPDFVVSMKQLELMLKESVSSFPKFDGIIAIDTHVLVGAIRILGEFNIGGRKYSADIDKRCDCPRVIYELEDYSTRPVAFLREDRKDILGILLYQIMQRSFGISPSKYWGRLFQMFLEETRQKHVLFYFHDEEAQKGIEAMNFAGRILPFEGDYLHISDVNFAGAKSNMFIKQSVKQEIEVAGDGTITKTVTISYKNPMEASNCNLEAGQLCLNGILRNWLRVFVPEGSTLLEFTGSEKETVTYNELGKTVFEGFMTVKPQGAAEVRIRYKLPFKESKGKFDLLIQKQPGTNAPEYTVIKNSKQIDKFSLLTDKKMTVK